MYYIDVHEVGCGIRGVGRVIRGVCGATDMMQFFYETEISAQTYMICFHTWFKKKLI